MRAQIPPPSLGHEAFDFPYVALQRSFNVHGPHDCHGLAGHAAQESRTVCRPNRRRILVKRHEHNLVASPQKPL
jgi:hypothetical protein